MKLVSKPPHVFKATLSLLALTHELLKTSMTEWRENLSRSAHRYLD